MVRGVVSVAVLIVSIDQVVSYWGNQGESLAVGFWTAWGFLMATIAWQSFRIYFYSSYLTSSALHVHSPTKDARIDTMEIAGAGVVRAPSDSPGSFSRWMPVVWTESALQALPNIVSIRRDKTSFSPDRIYAGTVAKEIHDHVLRWQGPSGQLSKGIDPPDVEKYEIFRVT